MTDESEGEARLTLRQRLFAMAYVANGGNGTQAAIEAGYGEDGAAVRASENVRNRNVATEIERISEERLTAMGITADYVLSEIHANHRSAKVAEKWSDSTRALELLGKHLKMFTDRTEHGGEVDINATVRRIAVPKKDLLPEAGEQTG